MITYPTLKKGATIGVTAPSSGVPEDLHELIRLACSRMESRGYSIFCKDTVWTQEKAKSAPATNRAAEFNALMQDENVDIIIPPWGGELLIEILDKLDFHAMQPKWVLGYSDVSVLLLAITLKTGMATAHGTNLVDLRGADMDETTAMWETVLSTQRGESVLQYSSPMYQKEWQHANPSPHIFHLTEPTVWKTTQTTPHVNMQGRLLGGCIDIIRHVIGTPYGDVQTFQKEQIGNEAIIWYLENCELSATDLRRSLVQMKLAGWFDHCAGIMFGRSPANQAVEGYTVEDVYQELAAELQVPVLYDVDCGHMPPQITFINGAFAEVELSFGKGSVRQYFRP
ncbi:muramoyltetrapeptide carboxypeptidase LdcA involved in peptidoglycan recycling [Brevibacillus sp. AG162]|uniref:S66 family peptidase n=1 Tax=Brevibacillus sp. AG162 TaxID=2572910 RepID=UPI00114E4E5B|nr:S66 peptidase family protein [Brevibacillus sp. AG162]TQK53666.1 muramoyltetrapeptide carboxypeptidase LdcA involved in peptidoglycan recycling [Brevibacillus sp. AG162]